MRWSDVWILYRRELRSAFRERTIVINTLLLPIVLYPVMLWAAFSAMVFVQGLSEGTTSRVAVFDLPAAHAALGDSLASDASVALRPFTAPEEALAALERGEVDAVAEFLPAEAAGTALPGNFRVRVSYDRATERSRRARDRVEGAVDAYRTRWLEDEARRLGIGPRELEQFLVEGVNVASERQMGALILGQLVPLFLVIMVALGCFVPSVDTTAGERERSTWETLMTVSASRTSIVVAKYLYVATLGVVAGVLNVLAVFVSIGAVMRPLVEGLGEGAREAFSFAIPLVAIPVMAAGAAALALFFAAAMMILASFARTFKDGQGMVTPVYWLALLPFLMGDATDRTLDPRVAAIPIANVAMMIRDALRGVFLWPWIVETLVVVLLMVAACLWVARQVLRFEDHLLGSFDGSFWRFARERMLRRGAA